MTAVAVKVTRVQIAGMPLAVDIIVVFNLRDAIKAELFVEADGRLIMRNHVQIASAAIHILFYLLQALFNECRA